MPDRLCMPVQYASHADAVQAIVGLSGQNLGGKVLKCSWGRYKPQKAGAKSLQMARAGGSMDLTLQREQQLQQMTLQQQLVMQQHSLPQE